jgi:flagellar basal-body rod protein FlgB
VISGMFDNAAGRAVRTALGGLQLRQEAIGNNIANVDTPNYKAREVRFEEALQAELAAPREPQLLRLGLVTTDDGHILVPPRVRTFQTNPMMTTSLDGTLRHDGNTVDVDREMSKLAETQIVYNALAQVQTRRFASLRTAITEGRG